MNASECGIQQPKREGEIEALRHRLADQNAQLEKMLSQLWECSIRLQGQPESKDSCGAECAPKPDCILSHLGDEVSRYDLALGSLREAVNRIEQI